MAPPEVTIEQGKLRGSTGINLRGETFLKFQGIPYAKPPLGELRFKVTLSPIRTFLFKFILQSPQPPGKWTGVFDASKEGDVCYSRDLFRPQIISGSENCLVLNVYTKTIPDEKKKNLRPVLFWIHGGGFVYGSGTEELYAPDYLITEDVVVVTINYRLGILGEFVFILNEIQNKNNLSQLCFRIFTTGRSFFGSTRQCRHEGHGHGLEMGAEEYRQVRWRSQQRHNLWRECRGSFDPSLALVTNEQRSLP
jgi:carboxylesterase type B